MLIFVCCTLLSTHILFFVANLQRGKTEQAEEDDDMPSVIDEEEDEYAHPFDWDDDGRRRRNRKRRHQAVASSAPAHLQHPPVYPGSTPVKEGKQFLGSFIVFLALFVLMLCL